MAPHNNTSVLTEVGVVTEASRVIPGSQGVRSSPTQVETTQVTGSSPLPLPLHFAQGQGQGFGWGRQNPYVFVVGCARSGTTLMQRMLDNHPQLAVANDSHFIPRAIEDVPIGVDPPLTPELVEWVRTYRRFSRLGLSHAVVYEAATKARTYREFVSALYSEYGRLNGKRLAGEKTPDYVRHLPRLHALFPWVRTIHIIRDGRDVALSTLDWAREDKGPGKFELWEEEPVAVCALWWRWHVRSGRQGSAALSQTQYCEVKYEDLVAQPEKILHALADFLDLPFAQEMLTYYVGKARNKPGLSAKKAWLPPTPGLRDWRAQMRERDVELFEALAGDLLTALGYERGVTTVSPHVIAVAEQCRQWWESAIKRWKWSAGQPLEPVVHRVEDNAKLQRDKIQRGKGTGIHSTAPSRTVSALSSDNVDLARRDSALPGLATVLDPEAFVGALRRSAPDADLGAAHITYVKYKPGTVCLVGYRLTVAGTVVDVYAKAYGADASEKMQKALEQPGEPGALGRGRIPLEDYQIVVSAFPNDAKVEALPSLMGAETRFRLLHKLFPDRPSLWMGTVQRLVYKPERRYVARLVTEDGPQAVLKLYTPPGYKLVQRRRKPYKSRSPLRLATRIGKSDRHAALAFEWLPGRLLGEAILDPQFDAQALATVGAAIAQLHTQIPAGLQRLTRETEASTLLSEASMLGLICPPLARLAETLAYRIATDLVKRSPVDRLIHGDFHAWQVLLDGDTAALLDLDRAVCADPMIDLGVFAAHLEHEVMRGNLSAGRAEPLMQALLAGYAAAAGQPVADDQIQLYTAVELLRLAPHFFRYYEPDWPERIAASLDRVESILALIRVP
jgi:hypothetical protein